MVEKLMPSYEKGNIIQICNRKQKDKKVVPWAEYLPSESLPMDAGKSGFLSTESYRNVVASADVYPLQDLQRSSWQNVSEVSK